MGALPERQPWPEPSRRRRVRRYHPVLPPPQSKSSVTPMPPDRHSRMSVQRMAASLALMAGPGLGAHWLLSPMRAHDPHQAVATAVLVLEAEQAGLERWLKEADRGRSPEQLRRQLRQHELALARISPADCTLLVHAEMQHLQGRLAEQLPRKPKPPPGWPSWQKRFGPQIQAAQTNLEQCRSASKIARS